MTDLIILKQSNSQKKSLINFFVSTSIISCAKLTLKFINKLEQRRPRVKKQKFEASDNLQVLEDQLNDLVDRLTSWYKIDRLIVNAAKTILI